MGRGRKSRIYLKKGGISPDGKGEGRDFPERKGRRRDSPEERGEGGGGKRELETWQGSIKNDLPSPPRFQLYNDVDAHCGLFLRQRSVSKTSEANGNDLMTYLWEPPSCSSNKAEEEEKRRWF